LPYGNKSSEFLIERGKEITNYFLSQNIDTIVVACHTSSATSLPILQKLFPQVMYIDMLMPTIDMALKETKNNRIGIMATQATVDSHVHKNLLLERNLDVQVFEQACPDFVPLIESKAPPKELEKAIKEYLKPLLKESIDTLILGCTHYAFLEEQIQKQAPRLKLISAASCLKGLSSSQLKTPLISFKTSTEIS
jgi:glutamate racemase